MHQRDRELDPDAGFVAIVTIAILSAGAAISSPGIFQGNLQSFLSLGMPQSGSSAIAFTDPDKLFATANPKESLGVRAICAAEGNCDFQGNRTALSKGHVDPGNGVWNRGWCSDQGRGKDEAEADIKCLEYVRKWLDDNADAQPYGTEVFLNAIDLANQSSNKSGLADKYKQSIAEGREGIDAIAHARVEAFRHDGELSAKGLFKVCSNPRNLFSRRLRGMRPYSEEWRYRCIHQDQERRVKAINKVIKQYN
jgi:D-alanyl-D-alanine dipeptidase